jgi:thiol:disulfide interchange protein DsbD
VSFQGCAEQGICYPPITKTVDLETLSIAKPAIQSERVVSTDNRWTSDPGLEQPTALSESSAEPLKEAPGLYGNFASTLAAFAGFGLLLAFTPCVFPMIPILSGMLAHRSIRTGRSSPKRPSMVRNLL